MPANPQLDEAAAKACRFVRDGRYWVTPSGYHYIALAEWTEDDLWVGNVAWNPVADHNQAEQVVQAAVAKCGADAFTNAMLDMFMDSLSTWESLRFLATATAEQRVRAAVKVL